jgi:hypothetical protein
MRVHAGSIILEPGLTRADFDDVHRDGVWLAKAGFGGVETARDYVPLVRHARDAGLLEAEVLAVTRTPEATLTPLVVTVVVTGEAGAPEFWVRTTGSGAALLLGREDTDLYTPPSGLFPEGTDITRWGEFILNSESIRVDCYYWHNAYGEENVKSGRFGVNLGRLLERTDDSRPNDEDIAASNLNCGSESAVANSIIARQWKISVSRNYSGRNQIGAIHWRLEATYGNEPTSPTDTTCGSTCTTEMNAPANTALYDYIRSPMPDREPGKARTPRSIASAFPPAASCTLRSTTSGESPRGITRYQHTCTANTSPLDHTLTFHYTRDETKGFAPQPTAIPQ